MLRDCKAHVEPDPSKRDYTQEVTLLMVEYMEECLQGRPWARQRPLAGTSNVPDIPEESQEEMELEDDHGASGAEQEETGRRRKRTRGNNMHPDT